MVKCFFIQRGNFSEQRRAKICDKQCNELQTWLARYNVELGEGMIWNDKVLRVVLAQDHQRTQPSKDNQLDPSHPFFR